MAAEREMRAERHILIIDDNVEIQNVFRRVLEIEGFAVTSAQSGAEGLARLRERRFALVITDLMLPDILGYEVARALRSDPATAGVPIAAFTVRTSYEDELRAYAAGCDSVIAKPCSIDEFIQQVRRLVQSTG